MSDKQYDDTNRGALFRNDEKQGESHPDYKGTINVAGVDYWISSWLKTSAKGTKYMSLSVTPKERKDVSSTVPATQGRQQASNAHGVQRGASASTARQHREAAPPPDDDFDSDLPF